MSTRTVLIVDDDPAIHLILGPVLSAAGWTVRKAMNGERAVAAAEQQAFDAILMDVMMPGPDGIATVRALRARPVNCASPIILMSAVASETVQINGLFAGVVDYIPKPFSPREVLERICRAAGAPTGRDEAKAN